MLKEILILPKLESIAKNTVASLLSQDKMEVRTHLSNCIHNR